MNNVEDNNTWQEYLDLIWTGGHTTPSFSSSAFSLDHPESLLRLIFAGYVSLVSKNSYPIILYACWSIMYWLYFQVFQSSQKFHLHLPHQFKALRFK